METDVVKNVITVKNTENGFDIYLSLDGGATYNKIATVKKLTINPFNLITVNVGNYSDGTNAFVNYTPPTTAEEGEMIAVVDTGNPGGKRLYVYANGAWNYVNLS